MNLRRGDRYVFWPRVTAALAVIVALATSCRVAQAIPSPIPYTTPKAPLATQGAPPTNTAVQPEPTPTEQEPKPSPPTATRVSQGSEPTDTPVPSPRMTSPDYGIQAFLWWRPEVATRDLRLIQDMGFPWVKQVFAWSDIEWAGKGIFNWNQADGVVHHANEAGVKLLARLDRAPKWTGAGDPNGPPDNLEDFGDFCYAVASRYKGRIQAYQIWNEPNLAREWGGRPPDPVEYVRLLSIAYRRIKEADPDALVISAGLTPTGTSSDQAMPDTVYLEQMYQAGFQHYCDMVGMHAAGFKAPPELSPAEVAANKEEYGGERFFCFRHVEDMREIMERHGDGERQVVILEFGWTTDLVHPSYSWHAVTEEQQARYLVGAYEYARDNWQPWIALMSTIYIADTDWTEDREEYWWAITYPDYPRFRARPAYDALRAMDKVR